MTEMAERSVSVGAPDPRVEIRMTALHATRGANYWSRRPVTRLDITIGAYEDLSSAHVPGVTASLVAAMPGLVEHRSCQQAIRLVRPPVIENIRGRHLVISRRRHWRKRDVSTTAQVRCRRQALRA